MQATDEEEQKVASIESNKGDTGSQFNKDNNNRLGDGLKGPADKMNATG